MKYKVKNLISGIIITAVALTVSRVGSAVPGTGLNTEMKTSLGLGLGLVGCPLRPRAAGERRRGVVLGRPCASSQVLYFERELRGLEVMLGKDNDKLFERAGAALCDPRTGRWRLRWARGLTFPLELHEQDGACEILVDYSLRRKTNSNFLRRLGKRRLLAAFRRHYLMSLELVLRQAAVVAEDGWKKASPVAREAACVMAARAWLEEYGSLGAKQEFLGEAGSGGLGHFLDEEYNTGESEKFRRLYEILFSSDEEVVNQAADEDDSIRAPAQGIAMTQVVEEYLNGLNPHFYRSCPAAEALPLFALINPVNAKKRAKKICDERILLDKRPSPPTYNVEIALIAAWKKNPKHMDTGNALFHLYKGAAYKAMKIKLAKRRHVDRELHERLTAYANDHIVSALEQFDIGRGGRFSTFLVGAIDNNIIPSASKDFNRRSRMEVRLAKEGRGLKPFALDRGGESGEYRLPDSREMRPDKKASLSELTAQATDQLAVLEPAHRVVVKLILGIRFETGPAEEWTEVEVAGLFGITRERVNQMYQDALAIMRVGMEGSADIARASFLVDPERMDDGDIYLATKMHFPHDSPLFGAFCEMGSSWIKDNAGAIGLFITHLRREEDLPEDAQAWLSFSGEIERARLNSKIRTRESSAKIRPSSAQVAAEVYNRFKDLVTKYLSCPQGQTARRKALLDAIGAFGPLNAPIGRLGNHHAVRLSDDVDGRAWQVTVPDIGDSVVIIPAVSSDRVYVKLATSDSIFADPFYHGYWDEKDACDVGISEEYADFYLGGPHMEKGPPSRPIELRVVKAPAGTRRGKNGDLAALEVFEKSGHKFFLYIDSNYAVSSRGEKTIPMLFWGLVFKDGNRRGIEVRANPDGIVMGRAYFIKGRFVPEPGPLLRAETGVSGDTEGGPVFLSRLRALYYNRRAEVPVVRKGRLYLRRQGNKNITYCAVRPFGEAPIRAAAGKTPEINMGEKFRRPAYHLKFKPHDNRVDVFASGKSKRRRVLERRFYDIDAMELSDPDIELARRLKSFSWGENVNPIFVKTDKSGRIVFGRGVAVDLGPANALTDYFVDFTRSASGVMAVSIYELDRPLKKKGAASARARLLHVGGGPGRPSLTTISAVPYKLAGIDRVLVQEKGYALGYTAAPYSMTALDRMQGSRLLDELRTDFATAGAVAQSDTMSDPFGEEFECYILRPLAAREESRVSQNRTSAVGRIREVQRTIRPGVSLKFSDILPEGIPLGLCTEVVIRDLSGNLLSSISAEDADIGLMGDRYIPHNGKGVIVRAKYRASPGAKRRPALLNTAIRSRLPNVCISMSATNAGAEKWGSRVVSRDVRKRVPSHKVPPWKYKMKQKNSYSRTYEA